MRASTQKSHRPVIHDAFSIVEAVFSIVLVGGLLVVSLDTVGASAVAQRGLERQTTAQMLAFELMSEIMEQDYEDPDGTPTYGVEASEGNGTRANFDDLDDYQGWVETPPQSKDGADQTEYEGWRRSVSVQRVNPTNYQSMSMSDTGIRKITVAVFFMNDKLAYLTALRYGKASGGISGAPGGLDNQ